MFKCYKWMIPVVLPLLPVFVSGQPLPMSPEEEAAADKARLREMRTAEEDSSRPVVLYGKVIDQFDKPVAGADVLVHVTSWLRGADDNEGLGVVPVTVKTTADGQFRIKGTLSGIRVGVVDVVLEGYEFQPGASWTGALSLASYKPDPANPEILRVRKREAGTFLLRIHSNNIIDSADQVFAANLMERLGRSRQLSPTSERVKDGVVFDLKYRAGLSSGGTEYELVFERIDESGGVQRRDEKLYTAPEGGYLPAATVRVPVQLEATGPVYVYVKSRRPSVYARLEVLLRGREDDLVLDYNGVANPYGDRNLEMEPAVLELPDVYAELEQEARKALKKGRLPTRPDLAKRIADGKAAKEAREKSLRARMLAVDTQPSRPTE